MALYNVITADPNSLLWRTAWSIVYPYRETVLARSIRQSPACQPNLLRSNQVWCILPVLIRGGHGTHAGEFRRFRRGLWRAALLHAAGAQLDVMDTAVCISRASFQALCSRQLHEACSDFSMQVKLLARDSCEFCTNISRRLHKVHWKLGVRCCTSCFHAQTCTKNWCACCREWHAMLL